MKTARLGRDDGMEKREKGKKKQLKRNFREKVIRKMRPFLFYFHEETYSTGGVKKNTWTTLSADRSQRSSRASREESS